MKKTTSAFLKAFARTASAAVEAASQAQMAKKPAKRRKKSGCTPCDAKGDVFALKEKLFG